MYVVTFYSYKGGVGRTMALVNVAAMLAKSGRRVLAVDFDLEAPSLPSFEIFKNARVSPGIVDYVSEYRRTGVAPNCEDFIVPCEIDGDPIWVMPAGRHLNSLYADELNNIDWKVLYEEQDGYLFFEDMKQQWSQYKGLGFDYVLIDSRTGHTDVGGICTRHLPDAVSVMFLPNDSNITGLIPIVKNIRDENKVRPVGIDIHVTPSNVPDLDDEKGILAGLLDYASEKLNRGRDFPATIHHYQSLDILSKGAFSITRPHSKLAKELEELRLQIIGRNFVDREGAIYTVSSIPEALANARKRQDTDMRVKLHEQTRSILLLHPNDGEIGFLAAQAFDALGDQLEELHALGVAIESGYDSDRARLIRGVKSLSSSEGADAGLADLKAVLNSETATVFELIPALQILKEVSSDWPDEVALALSRPDDQYSTLISMVGTLMSWREATPQCAKRLLELADFSDLPISKRAQIRNHAVLCLIAAGKFHEAMFEIEKFRKASPDENELLHLFNHAVAKWAVEGSAPVEAFIEIVHRSEMQLPSIDVNARQCLALAFAALGEFDAALKQVELAEDALKPGEITFSCWTYLSSTSEEMARDLEMMRTLMRRGKAFAPPFFAEFTDA